MTRISKIDQVPISIKPHFTNDQIGDLFGTIALVPELLEVVKPFISMILGPSSLDFRIKELVILRVSFLQRCRFCSHTHAWVAHHHEVLSKAEIQSLLSSECNRSLFALSERRLLAWVDVVGESSRSVPEYLLLDLKESWEDFEIVELTMLIGAVIMLNRYCSAFAITPSDVHVDFVQQHIGDLDEW